MANDLEALAEKGRSAGAKEEVRAQRREAARADYRRYLTERVVANTFYKVHGSVVPPAIVVGVTLLGFAAMATTGGEWLAYAMPTLLIVGLVGAYGAHRASERMAIRSGIRWLESLPFEFDPAPYVEGLTEQRMNTRVRVALVFPEPVDEDARRLFSDACAGAVKVAEREWKHGRRLVLDSGQLSTYFPARGDRESYYSNELVHEWLFDLVDKAVRGVHARRPLARMVVELS